MGIRSLVGVVQIGISLIFLLVSCFFDYKERRVPDLVFIVFSLAALPTVFINIYFFSDFLSQLVTLLLHVAVSFAVFYTIYFLGFFGGADAILLIILSIIMPWPPSIQIASLRLTQNFPIFSISIFNNALIVSSLMTPYSLISNIRWKRKTGKSLFENLEKESLLKKTIALLFCIKTEKSKIKPYDMIAEESGRIVLKKVQDEDLTEEDLENAPENVFIVFSTPMTIFITLGFIISIFIGDVLMKIFWSLVLLL